MIELRPYQESLINDIRQSLRTGHRRVCAVLGCGGGKSIIQGTIARLSTSKGYQVLFLVHRRELCEQIRATFEAVGVNLAHCEIAMVQTASRRLGKLQQPALILVDECHHSLSNSYRRIIEYFPQAVVCGFTATPLRMNEGGLGEMFDQLVLSVSTAWLIEHNYLAPYKYYGVTLAETNKLHTRHGDFDKAEVERLMNQSAIFGSAVENWLKYAKGKRTIIYCSSIETSKATVKAFQAQGISAVHLDGSTQKALRASTVDAFRKGDITILSNVDLFGEGFDVPDCECVVLLRPTKSLSLHIQQSMRSMRYKPGKLALILDHVGNFTRHGLPDDERVWSLESKKHKEKAKVLIRQCANCFTVFKASLNACPTCGLEVQHVERHENKTVEGVILKEVSKQPYQDYKKCDNWYAMEIFRKAHKYHIGWSLRKAKELGIDIPSKYYHLMRKLKI